MTEAADRQRAQMRLSKHLQDLTIGEQEVAKRLAIQERAGEDMGVEGAKLKKLWRSSPPPPPTRRGCAPRHARLAGHAVLTPLPSTRRSYLEEDMLVAGASAEVRALTSRLISLSGVKWSCLRIKYIYIYIYIYIHINKPPPQVEAEERARAHLIGHGDRIRAKFEQVVSPG